MLYSVVVYPGWLVGPFLAAGTAHWWACWSYFAVLASALIAHRLYVARRNPELRKHRRGIGEGTKRWDVAWNLLFWPLMALVPIVAGLDVRRGGTPMPVGCWLLGALALAGGFAISARAMAVNPFFEGTVRIQKERGHRVVEAGPYRAVRHPGYLGLSLWALGSPWLLLSWPALMPSAAVAAWIVLRTVAEDRTLRRELDGYEAYAARVRYRLIPFVW